MKRRSILTITASLAFIGMHVTSIQGVRMFSPSVMVFGLILGLGGVVIGIMAAVVNR